MTRFQPITERSTPFVTFIYAWGPFYSFRSLTEYDVIGNIVVAVGRIEGIPLLASIPGSWCCLTGKASAVCPKSLDFVGVGETGCLGHFTFSQTRCSLTCGRESTQTVINEIKSNVLEVRIGA